MSCVAGGAFVTERQISLETGVHELPGAARSDADVAAYREAVAGVLAELVGPSRYLTVESAERLLAQRLHEPAFAAVLSAVPRGPDAAIRRVLNEVRTYRQSACSSARDLPAMIRIALLAQIDLLWWGHLPEYSTDAQVFAARELLHLEPLRQDHMLLFRYRLQTTSLVGRAIRSAERRAVPDRAPHTAGLRFPCARAELIVILNQLADEFRRAAPPGTPPLWVTSLTRSVGHQRHLRSLGYAALLPSAHCVGYAADVEMSWFRRFGADELLQELLIKRQNAGQANVIDEGQAWHVCVRPGVGHALRLIPEQQKRG
jgi:hypothetical protein